MLEDPDASMQTLEGVGYESEGVFALMNGSSYRFGPGVEMDLTALSSMLSTLRFEATPNELVGEFAAVASMQRELEVANASLVETRGSRGRVLRLLTAKTFAVTAATIILSGTAAAAATGSLPHSVQHFVARTVKETTGLSLPDPLSTTTTFPTPSTFPAPLSTTTTSPPPPVPPVSVLPVSSPVPDTAVSTPSTEAPTSHSDSVSTPETQVPAAEGSATNSDHATSQPPSTEASGSAAEPSGGGTQSTESTDAPASSGSVTTSTMPSSNVDSSNSSAQSGTDASHGAGDS